MTYSIVKFADKEYINDKQFDTAPIEQIYKISRYNEPIRVLAYRTIDDNGEYGEQYAAELLFENKKKLLSWFKRRHIEVQELDDHESLPF